MVKARTLWPGVESPPAPTGQGAEHPVYPCQSNCISSPDCHLLNDPSNNTRVFPWIYHEHLRWLFVAEDSTDDAMWLFEITLGWLFTSKTLYPEMFNASLDTWLSFSMVEGDSRIFVDLETHELLVVE